MVADCYDDDKKDDSDNGDDVCVSDLFSAGLYDKLSALVGVGVL